MEQEKKNIGSLFDRIARRYDLFNHLSSCGMDIWWRSRAIGAMHPTGKVLDVATGTADLAIEMYRKGRARQIVGIDLSDEMMAIGQHKAEKAGCPMSFHHINAQQMPFSDATFDAVTCGYGIRNFADLDAGLSEFYRVMKPGGQLLILEFSYPQNKVMAALYTFYFRYIMTTIGSLLTGRRADFNYFYNSVRNFIYGEQMVEKLKEIGFTDVEYKTMTFGISTLYMATK